jgi:hypothetical protein
MYRRAVHDLKCPAERVLMRRGRAVKPKINVDVKSRSRIDRDRRFAKTPFYVTLSREFGLVERPFQDLPGSVFFGQARGL